MTAREASDPSFFWFLPTHGDGRYRLDSSGQNRMSALLAPHTGAYAG